MSTKITGTVHHTRLRAGKLSCFLLCIFLLIQPLHASEPQEPEVTIDSPPEVIAEDFVNVAIAPRAWKFRVWEWLGTDEIEIKNITDIDLEMETVL